MIEEIYNLFEKHPKISTDTRNLEKDSIFFALKGSSYNGNEFAKFALDNGCIAAIIDEKDKNINEKCYLVEDVLETLQEIAKIHLKKINIPVIGITGTNGKTTTKELIAAVLSKKYNINYTLGNLNNHIGVPLTILKTNKSHEIAIIEMGANHLGEIKSLCEIANPNFGLITNIGKAHLEGFGSVEGIIKTKGELYEHIYKNDGHIFINKDNEILTTINKSKNITTYGKTQDCDLILKNISKELTLKFEIEQNNNIYKIETNLVGNYNVENVMAAICIGNYFKIDINEIVLAIKNYIPTNNRSQIIKTESNTIIMDAYNANPSSMKESLINFNNLEIDNKVVILGDMLELGEYKNAEHENIVNQVSKMNLDKIFFVGNIFKQFKDKTKANFFENIDALNSYLKEETPIKNANILIKGSRGIKLETIKNL